MKKPTTKEIRAIMRKYVRDDICSEIYTNITNDAARQTGYRRVKCYAPAGESVAEQLMNELRAAGAVDVRMLFGNDWMVDSITAGCWLGESA